MSFRTAWASRGPGFNCPLTRLIGKSKMCGQKTSEKGGISHVHANCSSSRGRWLWMLVTACKTHQNGPTLLSPPTKRSGPRWLGGGYATPPGTRSVRKHCPSLPWLSVLFLLVEREEEQGYTGRHINGACHARWSSYAWRRMSARKVLSSNRISASATSSLGDIPSCSATFLENDLLLSKWSAAGPTLNPSTLSWYALGYRTVLPHSFLRFLFMNFCYLFAVTTAGVWTFIRQNLS